MSIRDLWKDRERPTLSFELFPARDDKAAGKLEKVIDSLAALRPDFVSVTFGAGGATREGSYNLAKKLKQDKGLQVLPYLAAYGLGSADVSSIIDGHRELGIDALFCIRGDKPEDSSIQPHPQGFPHASDLLDYVNRNSDLYAGAAGYPEGHQEAESMEKDLEFLELKVEKGAQFIITQYVYDNKYFFDFLEKCRGMGIDVPIIAGIMPIYSVRMTENLAAMCGAAIPQSLRDTMAKLPPDDKKAVTQLGVDIALELSRELLQKGVQGLHFYTMDRAKSVAKIVNQLKSEGLL